MSSLSPLDSFLTVAEVAERLSVNQQTVRNWIAHGRLPAIRVGQRRVRIRQSDFERFVGLGQADALALRADEEPRANTVAPGAQPASEPDARDRFLGAAVDVLIAIVRERPAELGAALRALAGSAERWAQALER